MAVTPTRWRCIVSPHVPEAPSWVWLPALPLFLSTVLCVAILAFITWVAPDWRPDDGIWLPLIPLPAQDLDDG